MRKSVFVIVTACVRVYVRLSVCVYFPYICETERECLFRMAFYVCVCVFVGVRDSDCVYMCRMCGCAHVGMTAQTGVNVRTKSGHQLQLFIHRPLHNT